MGKQTAIKISETTWIKLKILSVDKKKEISG
jgi:hypothetical protein